ncbi:MAG: DUF4142 domain-containing protein [Inquilinus sp.]|uniref:DUF4142 domain-containing protein n=1 Tax=Inquilinus sp. TaxID=1932117 RepID=UPI003F36203E
MFAPMSALAAQPGQPDTATYVQTAMSDMFEIKSGKLALEKSSKPDVKAFAQMMVDDHAQLAQKVAAAAAGLGMMAIPG